MEGRGWGVARSRMSEEWKKETKGGRGGEGIEKERGVERVVLVMAGSSLKNERGMERDRE